MSQWRRLPEPRRQFSAQQRLRPASAPVHLWLEKFAGSLGTGTAHLAHRSHFSAMHFFRYYSRQRVSDSQPRQRLRCQPHDCCLHANVRCGQHSWRGRAHSSQNQRGRRTPPVSDANSRVPFELVASSQSLVQDSLRNERRRLCHVPHRCRRPVDRHSASSQAGSQPVRVHHQESCWRQRRRPSACALGRQQLQRQVCV